MVDKLLLRNTEQSCKNLNPSDFLLLLLWRRPASMPICAATGKTKKQTSAVFPELHRVCWTWGREKGFSPRNGLDIAKHQQQQNKNDSSRCVPPEAKHCASKKGISLASCGCSLPGDEAMDTEMRLVKRAYFVLPALSLLVRLPSTSTSSPHDLVVL